jgi:hypothetical protein
MLRSCSGTAESLRIPPFLAGARNAPEGGFAPSDGAPGAIPTLRGPQLLRAHLLEHEECLRRWGEDVREDGSSLRNGLLWDLDGVAGDDADDWRLLESLRQAEAAVKLHSAAVKALAALFAHILRENDDADDNGPEAAAEGLAQAIVDDGALQTEARARKNAASWPPQIAPSPSGRDRD